MTASVFIGTSLDGFIARANGEFDFLPPGGGEPHGYDEFMATVDALVIGRKTFETVLAFDKWPMVSPARLLADRAEPCSIAPGQVGRFLLGFRHLRIVDMHQNPTISGLPIDLRFTTIALHTCAVSLLRGREMPIEFGPRGIAIDVHLNVARRQLAVGKHTPHYVREESLYLVPTVRVAERVNE